MSRRINAKSKHAPSLKEQKMLIKDVNEVALYLYNYYVSTYGNSSIDLLDDIQVGKTVGWTPRKVRDNRNKLVKAGWIWFSRAKHGAITNSVWVLGKELTAKYNKYSAEAIEKAVEEYMHAECVDKEKITKAD